MELLITKDVESLKKECRVHISKMNRKKGLKGCNRVLSVFSRHAVMHMKVTSKQDINKIVSTVKSNGVSLIDSKFAKTTKKVTFVSQRVI